MNIATQSSIFFLISSIGFVLLWVLFAICLFYAIKILRHIKKLIDLLEKNIDSLNEDAKDLLFDIQESTLFRLFFPKKRRRNK
ncbi:MAG: hypothetical protein WCQ32_01925 [bacterium]